MKANKLVFNVISLCALLLVGISSAHAQATRTWVSGVGDDANPCSRTAPCKTFAGAISKTAASGEIDALDPGGFGAVTITKAITIDGETGNLAGVLVSAGNGITVNAGASDVVVIRNLTINGVGGGARGISFLAGAALHVEHCSIFKFLSPGIDFEPSAAGSTLSVKDTFIRDNVAGGILVRPTGVGSARVAVDGVRLERNTYGMRVEDNSQVTVRNSLAASNTNNGFLAVSLGSALELNLETCVATNNGTNGIVVQGAAATIRITNCTVTDNNRGLFVSISGQIISYGNNRIGGNTTSDGAPTTTISQQ